MPLEEWEPLLEDFFAKAGLPENADALPAYLTNRLNEAYDRFLDTPPSDIADG